MVQAFWGLGFVWFVLSVLEGRSEWGGNREAKEWVSGGVLCKLGK